MLEKQRAENKPIDLTPMSILNTLISTQKGWILRQVTKYASVGGALITVKLQTLGIITDDAATVAFCVSLAGGVAEFLLSKWSAPIAAK